VRQRTGALVGLRTGHRNVYLRTAGQRHRRGLEAVVDPHLTAQGGGQGEVVAGDDHVEVGSRSPEQRVPDRASDQVRVEAGRSGRRTHLLGPGQGGDAGSEALEVDVGACGHGCGWAVERRLRCCPYHDGLRG
jgi:hypothetical protein